jgi:two-component system cell cycle response regulator
MSRNILIVEDDLNYRAILAAHLRKKRYGVLVADNIEQASRALAGNVDLIILEIALGKTAALGKTKSSAPPRTKKPPGYELLKIIRERPSHPPVIVLTVLHQPEHEVACIRAGADSFLRQPVDLNVLTAYIEKHLCKANLLA